MKTKKITKQILTFLLCLVLLVSMPLNLQAQAVAVESWVVYALITYLASAGITITAVGGVEAMVEAMGAKAREYKTQTGYDLFEVIQGGVSIQPPQNGGPNWNPNRGYFFFTANAANAVTAFIIWLVSDGGWVPGEISTTDYTYFLVNGDFAVNGVDKPIIYCSYYEDGKWQIGYGSVATNFVHTPIPNDDVIYSTNFTRFYAGDTISRVIDGEYVKRFTLTSSYEYTVHFSESYSVACDYTEAVEEFGYTVDDIECYVMCGDWLYLAGTNTTRVAILGLLMKDGSTVAARFTKRGVATYGELLTTLIRGDDVTLKVPSGSSFEIPVEIPQIELLPDVGVLLDTGVTAAETLDELGDLVENLFTDTGTIPQPSPVIQSVPSADPQPQPSTQPSPAPDVPEVPDIDGLGLPSLGEALANKFPFSIPSDLKKLVSILAADRITPYFEVNLFEPLGNRIPFAGDTTFVIDFAEYEELGQISRWASVIGYTLFLLLITKGMIGW